MFDKDGAFVVMKLEQVSKLPRSKFMVLFTDARCFSYSHYRSVQKRFLLQVLFYRRELEFDNISKSDAQAIKDLLIRTREFTFTNRDMVVHTQMPVQ